MRDTFFPGVLRRSKIAVGLAVTTDACRRAMSIHQTSELATVAIGRLLTSATLATFCQSRKGQLSLQVVGQGPLGNMFADVTDSGQIRTMVKNPRVELPRLPSVVQNLRPTIGHGFGEGTLSVIWQPLDQPFAQSTTSLVSGELDEDVESFLTVSDQVPTALIANVTFSQSPLNVKKVEQEQIEAACGVVLQAMPDTDSNSFVRARDALRKRFSLHPTARSLDEISEALGEEVESAGEAIDLEWKCRCNYERVVNSLRMLGPIDLADMVHKKETAQVDCEFCGAHYEVPPEDVTRVYEESIRRGN